MAFVTLEDLYGTVEVILFPRDYQKYRDLLVMDTGVYVRGRASVSEETGKLVAELVLSMDQLPKEVWIQVPDVGCFQEKQESLYQVIRQFPGDLPLVIYSRKEKAIKRLPAYENISDAPSVLEELTLLFGEKNIKLFGEPIEVHARIESLHGVSGHADMNGLLKWIGAFRTPVERVFVVHGEDSVTEEFAQTVTEKFGYSTWAPYPCCEADLLTNEIVNEGVKIPVKAKKAAQRRADSAFDRLVAAGKRLLDVIYRNEGLSNKDKAKFETQINNLADKWEE